MATYNINLNQGSDRVLNFVFKQNGQPVDLTGYNCVMQVRTDKTSKQVIDTLAMANKLLAVESKIGKISVCFTNARTMHYPIGRLVYDIEIIAPNKTVTRVLEGIIRVSGEVTRV